MLRISSPFGLLTALVFSAFAAQSAFAQEFVDTTVKSDTSYDSEGFGVYDLASGSLKLDGTDVFGAGTSIIWNIPATGGEMEFESDHLIVTDGELSVSGDPINLPPGYSITNKSNDGSLQLNGQDVSATVEDTGGTLSLFSGGVGLVNAGSLTLTLRTVGTSGGPGTITTGTVAVPEPSTWALVLGGVIALVALGRRSELASARLRS